MLEAIQWTEEKLANLGPHEYTYLEYKGSALLYKDSKLTSAFLPALSKQLSAFANGGGGRLIIGLDDHGRIDGGLPMDLKGGTRSWLEDVLPGAVDPPLSMINVHEVGWPGPDGPTQLRPGCAVYVIEIESSPYAPHQALDYRFYLRIAGKSRPMGSVHIQDVMRRTRSPSVVMRRVRPYGAPELDDSDPRGACVFLRFHLYIANEGGSLAQHVGSELILPRPLVIRKVRQRMGVFPDVILSQSPGEVTFFRNLGCPLFPRQEVKAMQLWAAIHPNNAVAVQSGDVGLRWRVFADDALPVEGKTSLNQFGVVQEALTWLASAST